MNIKKRLNTLSNMHDKEIQELKKQLKENKGYIDSNKKDKSKVMKKSNELNKEIQEHIKEKQIIEQELSKEKEKFNEKKKQELNKKDTRIK